MSLEVKMTQDEIRVAAQKIAAEIGELKDQIEMLQLKREQLQRKCDHPADKRYSAQGDVGWYCPDCGRQT